MARVQNFELTTLMKSSPTTPLLIFIVSSHHKSECRFFCFKLRLIISLRPTTIFKFWFKNRTKIKQQIRAIVKGRRDTRVTRQTRHMLSCEACDAACTPGMNLWLTKRRSCRRTHMVIRLLGSLRAAPRRCHLRPRGQSLHLAAITCVL